MSRYPFRAAVNDYLGVMEYAYADSTFKEMRRRLTRMEKDFRELYDAGKIQTMNPAEFNDLYIISYIGLLRGRGMQDGGVDHNIDALSSLLGFIGNMAVDRARKRFPQHFPHSGQEMQDPISDEDREKIINYASQVPNEDWRRMLAYAMTVTGICTGLRPQELRPAKLEHLNLDKGTMHTDEVKGKQRYGKARDTAIHPDGIPFLHRYLKARAMALEKEYLVTDLLFPSLQNLQRGREGRFSTNGTTDLRSIVKRETGVEFDFRACRRTWGQVAIDDDVPVDAVSRMMGHKTTKTTETYYGRKKNNKAVAEAQQIWRVSKPPESVSPPRPEITPSLIDKRERLPGYW